MTIHSILSDGMSKIVVSTTIMKSYKRPAIFHIYGYFSKNLIATLSQKLLPENSTLGRATFLNRLLINIEPVINISLSDISKLLMYKEVK